VAATIKGKQVVTVVAAAARTFTVTGFPSPITAGTAGTFTVTAKDAYGNIASGYRGTVHFTSSDSAASLPANYTFTATDNGVQTFSATLNTAGTQSITATDRVTGTITGTQSGIQVSEVPLDSLLPDGTEARESDALWAGAFAGSPIGRDRLESAVEDVALD